MGGHEGMKVLVVGANGQIGKILCEKLSKNQFYTPIAMIRHEEQSTYFKELGVKTVLGDVEKSVDHLAEVIYGSDAIVFTAGSGGHTGYDKTLLVDLDGAVKTMEAAEKVGVRRFIMISAIQAHNRENWNKNILPYFVAKHYADRILQQSDLDYTIIRPGGLLNEAGTGKVSIGENLEHSTIPREDVASMIIACLEHEHTYHRSFDLVSGSITIDEAVQQL